MEEIIESRWNGYRRLDFKFLEQNAVLVCPEEHKEGNKWLYKIEYFDAFPAFELAMLKRGYYVAHVNNKTRWATPTDIAVWPKFCDFLTEHFGLNKKCVPVGLSCGGMQSVYFSTLYPEYVAAIYLDAPVMNFLSCPYGLGASKADFIAEFENATGFSRVDMLSYRNQPLDCIPQLFDHHLPIIMISGNADTTVPYEENGQILVDYFRKHGGVITEIIKPGGDHHPSGLPDLTPIVEFVEQYY